MLERTHQIVLGSRSPRRLELLRLIVPTERIAVVPPQNSSEPGFENLCAWKEIESQLADIARAKCEDVLQQIDPETTAAVIAADTVIVAIEADGRLVVLGQPPDDESWRNVVRVWFQQYLLPRPHTAATALCVAIPDGTFRECLVKTQVTFDKSAANWLDWYLQTAEPRGKAGGYGLQGAGGLFVNAIEGSPSNVIGLPLRETLETLKELHVL